MFHHSRLLAAQGGCFIPFVQILMLMGAESTPEVVVKCGETARLPCRAEYELEIQYRAISWYKIVGNGDGLTGIVRKDFRENIARQYLGFNGSIELDSTRPFSLIIHNVSREDFGTYQCSLWAPLGERNKQADVELHELDIQFERWWTILVTLPIVLTILASMIFCIYARQRKDHSDYKKFNNNLLGVQCENCEVPKNNGYKQKELGISEYL
ncbi:CD83 antigen-like [Mustelus asterias]